MTSLTAQRSLDIRHNFDILQWNSLGHIIIIINEISVKKTAKILGIGGKKGSLTCIDSKGSRRNRIHIISVVFNIIVIVMASQKRVISFHFISEIKLNKKNTILYLRQPYGNRDFGHTVCRIWFINNPHFIFVQLLSNCFV